MRIGPCDVSSLCFRSCLRGALFCEQISVLLEKSSRKRLQYSVVKAVASSKGDAGWAAVGVIPSCRNT